MRKSIYYICCLFVLYSCVACEGITETLYIYNDSDEAIYVYFQCGESDSLPKAPKLELFHFYDNKSFKDALGNPVPPCFGSPDYRINAYSLGILYGGLEGRILGIQNKPHFPCNENEATLFFITEKTMRNYDWETIHKNQLFTKKETLTKEELENRNWKYTYSP